MSWRVRLLLFMFFLTLVGVDAYTDSVNGSPFIKLSCKVGVILLVAFAYFNDVDRRET